MASIISQKSMFKKRVTLKNGVVAVNNSPTGKKISTKDLLRRRYVINAARM